MVSRRMTVPGGRDMRTFKFPGPDAGKTGWTGYRSGTGGTGRLRLEGVTVAASCSNGHSAFAKWHVHWGSRAYLIGVSTLSQTTTP